MGNETRIPCKPATLSTGLTVRPNQPVLVDVITGAPVTNICLQLVDADGCTPLANQPYKLAHATAPSVRFEAKTGADGALNHLRVLFGLYNLIVGDQVFSFLPSSSTTPVVVRLPRPLSTVPFQRNLPARPHQQSTSDWKSGHDWFTWLDDPAQLKTIQIAGKPDVTMKTVDALGSAPVEWRDRLALVELLKGNLPDFCRQFTPLQLADQKGQQAVVWVLCDFLAIGSNADYVRVPLSGFAAQLVADAWGCFLPTQKIVVNAFARATRRIIGHTIDAQGAQAQFGGHKQKSNQLVVYHDDILQGRRPCRGTAGIDVAKLGFDPKLSTDAQCHHGTCAIPNPHPFVLVAGNKKEVIISHEHCAAPRETTKVTGVNRLGFWGWYTAAANTSPDELAKKSVTSTDFIQNYFMARHNGSFADYSHGIRLVARAMRVLRKGAQTWEDKNYDDVLGDPDLCSLVIDSDPGGSESLQKNWFPYNYPKKGYEVPPSPWPASP